MKRLFLLFLAAAAAFGQGRAQQQAQPGRGAAPASPAAVYAGAIDETPVVTKHTINIGGKGPQERAEGGRELRHGRVLDRVE